MLDLILLRQNYEAEDVSINDNIFGESQSWPVQRASTVHPLPYAICSSETVRIFRNIPPVCIMENGEGERALF